MPLGQSDRERNYLRQRGITGDQLAIARALDITGVLLTPRQRSRIGHKLGHGLRVARKPPRRTEAAEGQ